MQNNFKLFVDLDGVLVDFDRQFKNLTGELPSEFESKYGTDKFWEVINNEGVKFWASMKWMSDGQQLWNYVSKYNPSLLSAPSYDESSKIGKRVWVKNNLPGVKLILTPAKYKQKYSGPDSILIDDREQNIYQWIEKGGIGILHKNAQDTIKQLQNYMKYNKLNENEEETTPQEPSSGGNREKIEYDIIITPGKSESVDNILEAFKKLSNYGIYAKNLINDPKFKKPLEQAKLEMFGPTNPKAKANAEKERGKPFAKSTAQAIDDLTFKVYNDLLKSGKISTVSLVYPEKSKFKNDEIVSFPKDKNPAKSLTEKIIKVVLKNAGINDYKISEKENLKEVLKKLIREEIKKVI